MDFQGLQSCLISTQQNIGTTNFLRIRLWTHTNTQINQGKLDSTGHYPLLSDLGGTPEVGMSTEGNAQEE
jgi:hypothetical protein